MENEIIKEKNALREKYTRIRVHISETEMQKTDALIASHLFDSIFYKDAKSIFVYISVGREVDTLSIIRRAFCDAKKVYVPRTGKSRLMEAVPIYEEEFFGRAQKEWPRVFGIPVPPENIPAAGSSFPDFVIAPSLAADIFGYRLGYGGGYYDKYIKTVRTQKTSTAIATIQRSIFVRDEALPREQYDMAVDLIVTENGIVIPFS